MKIQVSNPSNTLPVAYSVMGDVMCYADNSNARQRIRLVGESLRGIIIVPPNGRNLVPPEAKVEIVEAPFRPKGIWQTLKLIRSYRGKVRAWHYPVSNEITFFISILLSLFSGVPIILGCWDPPGGTLWDRKGLVASIRRCATICLMNTAIFFSKGLLLTNHPGFWKSKCTRRVFSKIYHFPNGTTCKKNRLVSEGIQKIAKRLVMACRVSELKNCWYAADFFIRLWQMDNEVSLVWIGGGLDHEVFQYMVEKGVPADRLFMPGDIGRDVALPYIATATYGLNLYPDTQNLKWNYLLKLPEFLSFGLPIISNNLPGSLEYVREGVTGIVVQCGNIKEAAERTYELINDPIRTKQMSENAIRLAQQYAWHEINSKMANCINYNMLWG